MIHRVRTIGSELNIEDRAGAGGRNALDIDAVAGQIQGKLLILGLDIDKLAQPRNRDLHF
jgi:hypothetical protein